MKSATLTMRVLRLRSAVLLVMTMAMVAIATPAAADDSKVVLVLHSLGHDAPGRYPFDTVFARAMRNAPGARVDLYIETLDPNRFRGAGLAQRTRTYLREKYAGKNIAVIAVVFDEALAFLLDERDPLFPTVPIAAVLLQRPHALPERVSAFVVGDVFSETVRLALKLNPRASQIAVIDGVPPGASGGNALNDDMRRQIETLRLRVPVVFLHNLPLDDLLSRVRSLPPDGIIFFARQYIDSRGQPIDSVNAAAVVARVAPAPLYVSTDTMVGDGGLGGMVISLEKMATGLAQLALSLSDRPSTPRLPADGSLVPMFDWRQVRRWGLDERLLPPDSAILFRELGIWDQYRWQLVTGISVTLLQTALIGGLVMQRARRRRIELALRESERHFRMMADTTPVLIWRSGTDQGCDFFNKPWLDFRGRTLEQEAGSGWTDGVHPHDRATCLATYARAFGFREPFRMEYRLQRADGEYRWVLDIGVPRYEDGGHFAGFIGSAIDITERKQLEQQNDDLAGRLISVQEEERARIARDLHDDVSQQLAAVSIMLSGLKRKIGDRGSEPEIQRAVTTLQDRTSTLADAIRNISHELHPSVLEHAGLVATLRRYCADVEEHHPLTVTFSAGNHGEVLPSEVSLCLFRVAQETITNAVRHASARTIFVQVMVTNESVELRVDDDGIGFVASQRIGAGLGLRSMHERVRLLRGHLQMESRPGRGTSLLVRIPLPAEQKALQGAPSLDRQHGATTQNADS